MFLACSFLNHFPNKGFGRLPLEKDCSREADVPTLKDQARSDTRLLCKDVVTVRPKDSQQAPQKRPKALGCLSPLADCLKEAMKPQWARTRLKQGDFRRICSQAPADRTNFYRLYVDAPRKVGPTGSFEGLLGLSVPRRLGNAVTRNRLKRRLRSIWAHVKDLAAGLDVVLIAKPGAQNASYAELRNALERSIAVAAGGRPSAAGNGGRALNEDRYEADKNSAGGADLALPDPVFPPSSTSV